MNINNMLKNLIRVFLGGIIIVWLDNHLPHQDYNTSSYVRLTFLLLIGLMIIVATKKITNILYIFLVFSAYSLLFSFFIFDSYHFFISMNILFYIVYFDELNSLIKINRIN